MKNWMIKNFGIEALDKIHVLYDKPNEKYYKLEGKDRAKVHKFYKTMFFNPLDSR